MTDYNEKSNIIHKSEVLNLRFAAEMHMPVGENNNIYYGIEARHGVFNPHRYIKKYIEDYENWCSTNGAGQIMVDHRDKLTITDINTVVGNKRTMNTANLFVGDELEYGRLHANAGINATAYMVSGKIIFRLNLAYH